MKSPIILNTSNSSGLVQQFGFIQSNNVMNVNKTTSNVLELAIPVLANDGILVNAMVNLITTEVTFPYKVYCMIRRMPDDVILTKAELIDFGSGSGYNFNLQWVDNSTTSRNYIYQVQIASPTANSVVSYRSLTTTVFSQ